MTFTVMHGDKSFAYVLILACHDRIVKDENEKS